MPTYTFQCKKCKNNWETQYSFKEYDEIVVPKLVPCVLCKRTKGVSIVLHPPMINLGATIGARAERNTKRLGGKVDEEHAKKIEKNKKKNKKSDPWYGKLGKPKMKEIFGETNEKEKKRKIQKYIREGK